MAAFKEYPFLLGFVVLFWFVKPTLAFGAGNIAGISSIEGQNCENPMPLGLPPLFFFVFLLTRCFQGATVISKMPSSRS